MIRREDGAGGKYMTEFLRKRIFSRLDSRAGEISLSDMEDSADFDEKYVFTTDSYTAFPPIFRGGSIGSLAVCGTSNDLAVMGAQPAYMSLALIIQEGFDEGTFERIMDDVRYWSERIGVKVITGDTKVVEMNAGIFVNTSGIGVRNEALENNLRVLREYRDYPYRWVRDRGLKAGDAVIVTGNIAEHGLAMLLEREDLGFEVDVESDVQPVWFAVKAAMEVGGVSAMKDPTRGGVAEALNEMAEKSGVGILVEEERIPVRDDVKGVCDALGLDPLTMANEGKVVMGVEGEMAEDVLRVLRKFDESAEIIGYTTDEFREVVVKTRIGTTKILPWPTIDPIPRVC
ncbi:hydrogenase expression/formation protein HypE [Geoglobus ahangari]|uniref:Hydrogenase expression/formation protein HypE n=1 Tax=Geoglobus ahangari TaxID=113653 RepID=A0A0F7IGR7_9EURY|nr:hydrogenase expression/formation protein HypE [Geoglobus ahangari]AKG92453.1 hydrogenase expression/formation protein HypE [Geoglobus ahangari]